MAQKQERRVEMKKISRTPSTRGARFALFRLFARFANDRMTGPGLGMKAFGPSRCFSTSLWRSSRCTQLLQKGGHGPSHLRQRRKRAAGLPRSIAPSAEDEPAPADCARRPRCASSVASAAEYSIVAHPRATPVYQSDSHAHASSASDSSG